MPLLRAATLTYWNPSLSAIWIIVFFAVLMRDPKYKGEVENAAGADGGGSPRQSS